MNKLNLVRGQSAFKTLAQKLYQKFQLFESDPNTEIRCLWELIQNAKDAPNKFNSVKIKQELNDSCFLSSHNGDAFEILQLHSVVAQYSTKDQMNNEDTHITGRYGTGFITSYIISRSVQLQGILKIQEQQDNQLQSKIQNQNHSENNAQSQKKQIQQTSLQEKSNDSKTPKLIKTQHCQHKIQEMKISKSYYFKFTIPMDRSGAREIQLPKKIQNTQKRLTQVVGDAQYQLRHNIKDQTCKYYQNERTVDCYDTVFKYNIGQQQKNTKGKIIQRAASNVKELIPYALLFNSKLNYYQFVDRRKSAKNISFSVEKKNLTSIVQNIFLFEYIIKTQYNQITNQFEKEQARYLVAYFKENKCLSAIPVSINQLKQKRVLKVNQHYSQIFKDFPLIGYQNLKWNAVINSSQFYPNEKRSQLTLSDNNHGFTEKVESNKLQLFECFQAVKKLYTFLSQYYCQFGKQNFLIFDQNNILTQQNGELKVNIQKHIVEIINTKFIPTQKSINNKNLISPKQLVFICISNNKAFKLNRQEHKSMSLNANEIFAFLFGQQKILNSQVYQDFYNLLRNQPLKRYLVKNQYIKIMNENDCFLKFEEIQKQSLKRPNDNLTKKLHQIYNFVGKCQKHKISVQKYTIFINKNDELKSFQKDQMKFNDISQVYQQLAGFLGIEINHFIVKQSFDSHFFNKEEENMFTIDKFHDLILLKYQKLFYHNNRYSQSELSLLYQFCLTFGLLDAQSIDKLKKFMIFQSIPKFAFNQAGQFKSFNSISLAMRQYFLKWFKYYYETITKNKISLKNFIQQNLTIKNQDSALLFLTDLFNDKFLGEHLGNVHFKLSWSKFFVNENTLQKFDSKVEYPNTQDIQMYDLLNFRKQRPTIQDTLIQKIYPNDSLKHVKFAGYHSLFQPLKAVYTNLSLDSKAKILKYIESIHNSFSKQTHVNQTIIKKHQAWKIEIDARLTKLLDLKRETKLLQDEEIKQFVYDLINSQPELRSANQIYKRKGNKLYFQEMAKDLNGEEGHKKRKMQ